MKIKYYILFTLLLVAQFVAKSQSKENHSLLKDNDLAPNFSLLTQHNKLLTLDSLKGKVVLLDFWASWCGPCREANEELITIYNEYHAQGFEIVSVSLDRKKEYWQRAIRDDKLFWENHVCDLMEWNSPIVKNYGIDGLPSTFLIDEYGYIISSNLDYYDLKKHLKSHLEAIKYFPAKTTGIIHFNANTKAEILDQNQKSLGKYNAKEIDIASFPNGVYWLKLNGKLNRVEKLNTSKIKYSNTSDSVITLNENAEIYLFNSDGKMLFYNKSTDKIPLQTSWKNTIYLVINGNVEELKR